MNNRKESFLEETINPDLFNLENVVCDNACFYRAIANGIINNSKYKPDDFFNQQTLLAKEIQFSSYDWLTNNKDFIINWNLDDDNQFEIKVTDLIEIVHNISYDEYVNLYKFFAGDYIVKKDENNITNEVSYLDNRWGSYVEQIAISNKLKIPIVVFILQKYDDKNNKIISGRIFNGKKMYQNTRLKICQLSGLEYISNSSPIYLLWKKTKDTEHYMSLYPINSSIGNELIKNLI